MTKQGIFALKKSSHKKGKKRDVYRSFSETSLDVTIIKVLLKQQKILPACRITCRIDESKNTWSCKFITY